MKRLIFLATVFLTFSFYAQNSYEKATLTFRNGEVIQGEAKRLLGDKRIKFKSAGGEKEEYNYREVKELKIKKEGEILIYRYKIIVGQEPKLMKVVKEYKGIINLYVTEHSRTYEGIVSITDNFGVYYLNKDDGINVVELGSSEIIYGKKFKKTAKKVFNDCPKIIEMIESKEFKRTKDIEKIIDYYYDNYGK